MINKFQLFDSHFHIIDEAFPLIANSGYVPDTFSCDDYLEKVTGYDVCGGAIVSGSSQAFDQAYLIAALEKLGPAFVGVTQLPTTVSDDEIIQLKNITRHVILTLQLYRLSIQFSYKNGLNDELA